MTKKESWEAVAREDAEPGTLVDQTTSPPFETQHSHRRKHLQYYYMRFVVFRSGLLVNSLILSK